MALLIVLIYYVLIGSVIYGVVYLSGSAATVVPITDPSQLPGFGMGLWHGLTAFHAFIVSLFDKSIGIYESSNSGISYNIGFLMGILAISSAITSDKNSKKTEEKAEKK